jgi:AcrR family transcriptional regulator
MSERSSEVAEQHPTKVQLLDACDLLIEEHGPFGFGVHDIQKEASVSIGSIYHHFGAFPHLVSSAMVRRAYRATQQRVMLVNVVLETANGRDEFLDGLAKIAESYNALEQTNYRFERVELVALARNDHAYRTALGEQQRQVTGALAAHLCKAQKLDWITSAIDAEGLALFLLSFFFGSVLNDLNPDPLDPGSLDVFYRSLLARL